jgi:hypothetical protein
MPDEPRKEPSQTSNKDNALEVAMCAQLQPRDSDPRGASRAANLADPVRSTDLVRVTEDVYAVRGCPHCAGSGRDQALCPSTQGRPERTDADRASRRDLPWCRCVRTEADVIRLHLAEITIAGHHRS